MNTENIICRMCDEDDCPVKEQIRNEDEKRVVKKIMETLNNIQTDGNGHGVKAEPKPAKKSMMDINKIILSRYLKERHTGLDNAVFSRELEYMLDMSGRDIRRIINALRKDGVPICSDYHKGYYYAEKQSEIENTLKGLGGHIDGVSDTIARLARMKAGMMPKIKSIRIIITPDEGPDQEMMVLVP